MNKKIAKFSDKEKHRMLKIAKFSDMVNHKEQIKEVCPDMTLVQPAMNPAMNQTMNPTMKASGDKVGKAYSMKITYPLNNRELILKVSLAKRGNFKAKIHITNHSAILTLRKVQNEEEGEFCLHELNELAIADVIENVYPNVSYFRALENVAHFLNSFSLNQYVIILKTWNPFKNYVECDIMPRFEVETSFLERMGVTNGKGQKSGEKFGMLNIKELKTSSNHTYRQKYAFKGLSIPKIDSKSKTKVKAMVKKEIKPNAQDDEQNKNVKAQELAISSKKVVKTRTEVKRMKTKTKEVKKRQRKGKSLLTAFRINRMEKRLTLNLNRTEIKHGKYI